MEILYLMIVSLHSMMVGNFKSQTKEIYPKELVQQLGHPGSHATSLNLDIMSVMVKYELSCILNMTTFLFLVLMSNFSQQHSIIYFL